MQGYARVCKGMQGYARVCKGVQGCARVSVVAMLQEPYSASLVRVATKLKLEETSQGFFFNSFT